VIRNEPRAPSIDATVRSPGKAESQVLSLATTILTVPMSWRFDGGGSDRRAFMARDSSSPVPPFLLPNSLKPPPQEDA
jgi:hypothetical protein